MEASYARIPLLDARVTLVELNQCDEHSYADLWLMVQFQHFIIANSTFSWWLAADPAKQVIALGLEKRLGNWWRGFLGLLPRERIRL
jgi:hypothetical protein